MADFLQLRVEVVLRCDGTHVARCRLSDDTGNLARVLSECGLDGLNVVIRNNNGVGSRCTGDTRRIRQTKSSDTGTGRCQQRVHVTVVAAGELDDLGTASETASQAYCGHGGLSAGVDQTHLIYRRALNDVTSQVGLSRRRSAERQTASGGALNGLHHCRVRVAQNHWTPRADQVHIFVAINIHETRARGVVNETWGAADGTEGADRRVHATRRHCLSLRKELCRTIGELNVFWDMRSINVLSHGDHRRRPLGLRATLPYQRPSFTLNRCFLRDDTRRDRQSIHKLEKIINSDASSG